MGAAIKPLPFKPPRLIGLSESLLASHYENDYGGAVRRYNAIEAKLVGLDWHTAADFDINGLQREALIAANSIALHEVYFDGLGGADGLGSPAVDPTGPLAAAIVQDFGSLDAWQQQFVALARALTNGGWVVLSWSPYRQRLLNHSSSDPDQMPAQSASVPVLALDMAEHAYQLDFGADACAYIDAYLQNLHWDRPAERFAIALTTQTAAVDPLDAEHSISPEELHELLTSQQQQPLPALLDVCLTDDVALRHDKLPGAQFLTAEAMPQWLDSVPRDRPLVVYCVYGFQVSGNAATELRQRGHQVRCLSGGIAAWHAIGGPTEPLTP